jgi:hypothetical protein
MSSRLRVALSLAILGYAIPPAAVAAGLIGGWLTPHGDGVPTVLAAVVAAVALCATAARLARPAPEQRSTRLARGIRVAALAGAVLPATLAGVLLFIFLTAGSGE